MNQIAQQSMLSPSPLLKPFLISMLIALCCSGCSKNDNILSPGKPVKVGRNFQFDVTPANQFDDEASKKISLKLKLSISRINLSQNAKELLWDTIITKENLYDFTHKPSEQIATTITASPEVFQNLLFNYVIIYNHHGALVTRSQSTGMEKEEVVLKLAL